MSLITTLTLTLTRTLTLALTLTLLGDCEAALREMEGHVTYYEGVMAQEGLVNIRGDQRTALYGATTQGNPNPNHNPVWSYDSRCKKKH
jgi:hypothetical protein